MARRVVNNINKKERNNMSDKKCKLKGSDGKELDCVPTIACTDCEKHPFHTALIKYDGHEYEAYKDGVKYKSTDGENWVPEDKTTDGENWVPDGKIGYVLAEHDYTKIQNYIEAIRLIAEKVGTAESDCIEQLARDVGNYLYDLVKGDKDNG